MNIQPIIDEARGHALERDQTLSEYLEDVLEDILYEELLGFHGTPLQAAKYREALLEALSVHIR